MVFRGEIHEAMTQEQFNTAIRLHHRLEALSKVKEKIAGTTRFRLWYAERYDPMCGTTKWETVSEYVMRDISDILDRHDQMIRQEIDDEIANITKQIKEL